MSGCFVLDRPPPPFLASHAFTYKTNMLKTYIMYRRENRKTQVPWEHRVLTINAFLFPLQVLGPQNVGLKLLVPITFFYVVIFISGMVGNVAVCLVIVKNKSMHTATNYYLFSLAISDLMILVLGKNAWNLISKNLFNAFCVLNRPLFRRKMLFSSRQAVN